MLVSAAPLPINTLPRMLPVALIKPVVPILPPEILPSATRFPPLTLPIAVIKPAVLIFPATALPLTDTEVSVPTLVILGCAAVVTVPAVPAVVAVPAFVAFVALATNPVTFAPVSDVNPAPLPKNTLPWMLPVAVIRPVVIKFPPVILPVAVTVPLTAAPKLETVTTLAVP